MKNNPEIFPSVNSHCVYPLEMSGNVSLQIPFSSPEPIVSFGNVVLKRGAPLIRYKN